MKRLNWYWAGADCYRCHVSKDVFIDRVDCVWKRHIRDWKYEVWQSGAGEHGCAAWRGGASKLDAAYVRAIEVAHSIGQQEVAN